MNVWKESSAPVPAEMQASTAGSTNGSQSDQRLGGEQRQKRTPHSSASQTKKSSKARRKK